MRIELIAVCCLTNAACFTTTYVTKHPVGADRDMWHHNFVAGFVEAGAPVDLREVCPRGVARVKTEVTFINGLASGAVNGATSYALGAAVAASASDLDKDVQLGITTGYNFLSALFDPIWSPSTLTVTCIGSGGRTDPPGSGADPPPEPESGSEPGDDDFNAFVAPNDYRSARP